MIFQNSTEFDIFVKKELENLLDLNLNNDFIKDDEKIYNILYKFMLSSLKLSKIIISQTPDLNELQINKTFSEFSNFVNFNPSFTFQVCTALFRVARSKLSDTEFNEYKIRVQKIFEILFWQFYLIQTANTINALESINDDIKTAEIDDLVMRGYDIKEKIEDFFNRNSALNSLKRIDGFDECIKKFNDSNSKKYVTLTTANKIPFYRDVNANEIFNNVILLYINIYISYFNDNDNQGLISVNDFFFWFYKEKGKYKKRLQYLFEFVVTCCLVDAYLNIGLIFDMTRKMIKNRKSESIEISSFYFMKKNSLIASSYFNKIPKSIRLDINLLNNPLDENLLGQKRIFSITKSLPRDEYNFKISQVDFDYNNDVIIGTFNPNNIYHVFYFFANHQYRLKKTLGSKTALIDPRKFNESIIKSFDDNSSSYFKKGDSIHEEWYLNTFFNTFFLDNKMLHDEVMIHTDTLVSQLSDKDKVAFSVNFRFAKVLWFTHQKHKYLLSVLDSIYSNENQPNEKIFNQRLKGVFGYLIHLESVLDHLVELQNSVEAKNWINSFIPNRLSEVLEFEDKSQHEVWLANVLDFWEIGMEEVYKSVTFYKFHFYTNMYNTLLWFPLFSKKTVNFKYSDWRNSMLAELITHVDNSNNAGSEYWIMGEFLFDCAVLEVVIDYHDQRDKAKEIYDVFIQEYNYNEYLDFNVDEVVANAKTYIEKMQPYDEYIDLPCFNTSIVHFLESNKSRKLSFNILTDETFRVQVRAKTRLIVNANFLGAPIILSPTLRKTLEGYDFVSTSLFDPIKIQQTLGKYENYIEVLKSYNMNLMAIFEMYIQECNMCFLMNFHESLLFDFNKVDDTQDNFKQAIASLLVFIEDSITVDCSFYANSVFESNYMRKKNKFKSVITNEIDIHECREFMDNHFKLLKEVYPTFPDCLRLQAEELMVELLIHINSSKEIDMEFCDRSIRNHQRVINNSRKKISEANFMNNDEKKASILIYDFMNERLCFRVNSEIINMNNAATERLVKFQQFENLNVIDFPSKYS